MKKLLISILLVYSSTLCAQTKKIFELFEESEAVIEELQENFDFSVEKIIISRFPSSQHDIQFFDIAKEKAHKVFYAFGSGRTNMSLDMLVFKEGRNEPDGYRSDESGSESAVVYMHTREKAEIKCTVRGFGDTENNFFALIICKEEVGLHEFDGVKKIIRETQEKISKMEKEGKEISRIEIDLLDIKQSPVRMDVVTEIAEPFSVLVFSGSQIKHMNLKAEWWTGDSWAPRDICDEDEYTRDIECAFDKYVFRGNGLYTFRVSALDIKQGYQKECVSFILYK